MSEEKGFPMKIRINYVVQDSSKVCSHYLNASRRNEVVDLFNRYGIELEFILQLKVNDTILTDERIQTFYQWIQKLKGEIQNEEREKANSGAEGSDDRSRTKR